METCRCGFTTDPDNNCNGTHKAVKAVRDQIAKDIESIDLSGSSQINGLGVKILALKIARGEK